MRLKNFYEIAIPHKDIREGKFTLDTFAADLWSVYQNKGPEEYRNPQLFWDRTYETKGLRDLIEIARKRLVDGTGDAIIQLQTPFGGGKTHSLIALYHKAREWGVNTVVLDCTAFDARDVVLWEELERQLTGSVKRLSGRVSPGKMKLSEVLEENAPVIILIDELLEYMVKAAGVVVGDTTLADQTLAFIHELTEVAKSANRVLVVMTLPSSLLEHYSEKSEEYYQKLQKIAGRTQKVFTPVQEEEIYDVIRKRLFKRIDEEDVEKQVKFIVKKLEDEDLIPEGLTSYQYLKKFLKSYPFQPEVIDVLYHRWGSLPRFQRTRGVLRLLSIVVQSLIGKEAQFIRLSDFDLGIKTLRDELISIIGESRYYSVIDSDIIGENSGAKKVDKELGESNEPYRIGTRAATAIFMYSFSGGGSRGSTVKEIKLSCFDEKYSPSIVGDAILKLKDKLLYLHYENGRYYFSLDPSLNKLIVEEMNNVRDEEIVSLERELLKKQLPGKHFRIVIWPEDSSNVSDSDPSLKLVVIREDSDSIATDIIYSYGASDRVYKNTIVVLAPKEDEYSVFRRLVRKYIALKNIKEKVSSGDENLLKHKKEVGEKLKNTYDEVGQKLFDLYRIVYVPSVGGVERYDMGTRIISNSKTLEDSVYEFLVSNDKIVERMAPVLIEIKYLGDKEYISTKQLFESFLRTPGMPMPKNKTVIEDAIKNGVKNGSFGIGYIINNSIDCKYFRKSPSVTFDDNEAIVHKDVCESILVEKEKEEQETSISKEVVDAETKELRVESQPDAVFDSEMPVEAGKPIEKEESTVSDMVITIDIESGTASISSITRLLSLLRSRYGKITVTISAKGGQVSESNFEKIEETVMQLNGKIELQ